MEREKGTFESATPRAKKSGKDFTFRTKQTSGRSERHFYEVPRWSKLALKTKLSLCLDGHL